MKTKIADLSREEQILVLEANQKLQQDVHEDMVESEMYFIGEQLEEVRNSSDWEYGISSKPFIRVEKTNEFLDGLENLQAEYGIFGDDDEKALVEALALRDKYNDTEAYTDEADSLESKLEGAVQCLADTLASQYEYALQSLSHSENMIDYFTEFYIEARLNEDCYILKDSGTYAMHEDISYIKSYV